ncbi:MMPL family transporter [Bradyrhizobium sp. PMVTL-01]|uniref:hopanoid transporter HpnN n=1 Tax=Bradyrhizobium sp. PMVTL-01 TaxID=3434999 RepID=UPI003F707FD7
MTRAIVNIVDLCVRRWRTTVILGALLLIACTLYAMARFSINTDVQTLVSQSLPWHQRQLKLSKAFPQRGISVVVTASTPESAEVATDELAQRLQKNPELFYRVSQPDSGEFFERNGLLLDSTADAQRTASGLARARPFLQALATDPTVRGAASLLGSAAQAVAAGRLNIDQLGWPLALTRKLLDDIIAGKPAFFSWKQLLQGHAFADHQPRHFVEVAAKLDFNALQPGRSATDGIRKAASDLGLKERFGAEISLTGEVPMNDDQFSVIRSSAVRDTLTALFGVLVILWLALRSFRLIAAVFFSLAVGLAATAALGLLMVGSFNLISIAFFVLFVGLGVDFGIQFSVRYRTERHEVDNLRHALRCAAHKAGAPLALAAAATAIGFFAFLPTDYRGLSELGLIAGCGMLIAFVCSITLVPAMLSAMNPAGEPEPVGFKWLAPVDIFLQRHRFVVIAGTMLVVLAGTPLLFHLPFDFNPVDLQNPSSPSVATYRKLQSEPETNGNDAEVLAPSQQQAEAIAKRLSSLPEVGRVVSLTSLVPSDQEQKLASLRLADRSIGPVLSPPGKKSAPTDDEIIEALRNTARALSKATAGADGDVANDARTVASQLNQLASASPDVRQKAKSALIPSLSFDLERLRKSLSSQPITLESLPAGLVRDWQLPDGRARVQALAKGDANDVNVLRRFAEAVLAAEPTAAGAAISYYESARTVTRAFVEAGIMALVAIAILLAIALRRVTDVLLTLIPLLVAGALTLELSVLLGPQLNFADIVALPLLLGVGVAFKIYYIMAWRAGKTGLLQSTLTRAVVFSALTNAAAFGSMWASNYPGMSSMGKLMALALACTMGAAVLFQPVLMGQPRQIKPHTEVPPARGGRIA